MLTQSIVRETFGALVDDKTDAALLRSCDSLGSFLADVLGHTFGCAVHIGSTAAATVEITAAAVSIGGETPDTYPFATYTTLDDLVTAINAAGASYSATLLPQMAGQTPSTLLRPLAATVCGPTYDKRVCLWTTALYLQLSGTGETHLFLPLPVQRVSAVSENGSAVSYYATPGQTWLERRPQGSRWRTTYPGNIGVTYVPRGWGALPAALTGLLLDAFASANGLTPLEAESFGGAAYSYRRGQAAVQNWQQILAGPAVRPYAVRFHP